VYRLTVTIIDLHKYGMPTLQPDHQIDFE